jgi:endonuclease/exonuclease/phosphatase family metal-dependent hydrolase
MKLAKRILISSLILVVAYLAYVMINGVMNDWQPEERISIQVEGKAKRAIITDSILNFIIWNVGYGSLGAKSDFFYDDEGMYLATESMVYSDYALCRSYVDGAKDYLSQHPVDFLLVQEMDKCSDRSHQIKQYDEYSALLLEHEASFAPNYRVKNVPIPLFQPWRSYGMVESGLATWSKYQSSEVVRCQLPGNYPLPDRIFQLDRCLAVNRYKTAKGPDLVVINLHNSAYDPGDIIKKQQMPYLQKLALDEYAKGNFVLLGGDWNQRPPFVKADQFMRPAENTNVESNLAADLFPEGWTYAFDLGVPTNRKTKDPFEKDKTYQTLIDFYLVSPNMRVKKVKTSDLKFAFSDHQPVYLEIELMY